MEDKEKKKGEEPEPQIGRGKQPQRKKGEAPQSSAKTPQKAQEGEKTVPWQQQKKHLREADEGRQVEIGKMVEHFALVSTEDSLSFDPRIPSHERKWIHHFAEEFGLCHESVGLGTNSLSFTILSLFKFRVT